MRQRAYDSAERLSDKGSLKGSAGNEFSFKELPPNTQRSNGSGRSHFDSETEYKVDFLRNKLQPKYDRRTFDAIKIKVNGFLSELKTMKNRPARYLLEKMLKEFQKSMDKKERMIKLQRGAGKKPKVKTDDSRPKGLLFDYKTCGDWYKAYDVLENRPQDTALWATEITQFIDYLSNPAIEKRNSALIIQNIRDQIPVLLKDNKLFNLVRLQVKALREKCYSLADDRSAPSLDFSF